MGEFKLSLLLLNPGTFLSGNKKLFSTPYGTGSTWLWLCQAQGVIGHPRHPSRQVAWMLLQGFQAFRF